MKKRLIRWMIRWLMNYHFSDFNAVIGESVYHLHRNPVKRKVPEMYPASEK